MNQSDSSGSIGPSADLRTRITAALSDCFLADAGPSEMADAVIRELEYRYVLVPKNVTLVQWADESFRGQSEGNFKHERITDWITPVKKEK